jgi:hypothetical protein
MKTKITGIFILLCSYSFAQINQYNYKRELIGVHDEWHKLILPNELYAKLQPDFSDIRIYGITAANDTIEAPYILQIATEKIIEKEVAFNLINESKNNNGYYFTFEVPTQKSVNELQLEFNQQNFDWRIALQGSQNQREWFSIVDDYRIVAISNELTNFQFTRVAFPDSKYRYFRMLINSDRKPELTQAKLSLNDTIGGSYRNYKIISTKIEEEKKAKQSIITVDLNAPVSVCNLKIYVKDKFDYYRPIAINYLADSTKTPKGWIYNYKTLISGTLNSIENNEFRFSGTTIKKLQIIVENNDNQALHIDSVQVKGYVHELIVRFNNPAAYYLVYGSSIELQPHYDIERFADKIPTSLTALNIGNEQVIEKNPIKQTEPLFKNKMWLWGIMGLMIILLGGFSLKMMKQK